MADIEIAPTPPAPFVCPHTPHPPPRCYRRDGLIIATVFTAHPNNPAVQIRTCVTCGLTTDKVDEIMLSG